MLWGGSRSWGCSTLLPVGMAPRCPSAASDLGEAFLPGWRPTRCSQQRQCHEAGGWGGWHKPGVALFSDHAAGSQYPRWLAGWAHRWALQRSGEKFPEAIILLADRPGTCASRPRGSSEEQVVTELNWDPPSVPVMNFSLRAASPAPLHLSQSHRIWRGQFLGIKAAMPTPATVQDMQRMSIMDGGLVLPKVTLGNSGGDRAKRELVLLSSCHFKPSPVSRHVLWDSSLGAGIAAWAVGQRGQGQGCGDLFHIS